MNLFVRSERSEPELWASVLRRAGISTAFAIEIARRARRSANSFAIELRAALHPEDDRLESAIADELGVLSARAVEPSSLLISPEQCAMLLAHERDPPTVRFLRRDGTVGYLVSSASARLAELRRTVDRNPRMGSRIHLVSPKVLRAALVSRARPALVRRATSGLAEAWPSLSARTVLSAPQGIVLGVSAALLPVSLLLYPGPTTLALHAFFSLSFLCCVLLRSWAAAGASPPELATVAAVSKEDLPTYSVLIALYREADIVPELLVSLGRLVWPRGKLEIKLVCEEDDAPTLAAIAALRLRQHVEVIRVPRLGPRTKPKALVYALPFTSGEFVVLYDAEDRPHPLQLIEAWQRFAGEDASLACLQAPLSISNGPASILARCFAFEYAALFRGLLPKLAAASLVLPLGGTSNHFRRSALEEVGGWDPYNVTEDADLGLRLARFGYRTGTTTLPTFEDAPTDWSTWYPQRTRWLKGWMQTWLVHMRHPVVTFMDLGPRSFIVAQILFAGMVASAMAYPLFVLTIGWLLMRLAAGADIDAFHSVLLLVDSANIALGYLAFMMLGRQTLLPKERAGVWKAMLFTPLYWLGISYSAWRAFIQLFHAPHHWEKTPHPPRGRAATGIGRGAEVEGASLPSTRVATSPETSARCR